MIEERSQSNFLMTPAQHRQWAEERPEGEPPGPREAPRAARPSDRDPRAATAGAERGGGALDDPLRACCGTLSRRRLPCAWRLFCVPPLAPNRGGLWLKPLKDQEPVVFKRAQHVHEGRHEALRAAHIVPGCS